MGEGIVGGYDAGNITMKGDLSLNWGQTQEKIINYVKLLEMGRSELATLSNDSYILSQSREPSLHLVLL
jgi:hypothetical protein